MKQKGTLKRLLAVFLALTAFLSLCCVRPAAAGSVSWILMEAKTGQILGGEGYEEARPSAGLGRMMSLLLFAEALEQGVVEADTLVSVSKEAAAQRGSRVFLDAGSQYPFKALLEPAIVCGAGDAIYALAERLCGNAEAFTAAMNQRARQLGLTAEFADPTALKEGTHICARDLAVLACRLTEFPQILAHSGIWMGKFTHSSGRVTEMTNGNRLVREEGFDGMATGSTAQDGYAIAASFKSGGTHFICVVLGAKTAEERHELARDKLQEAAAVYAVKTVAEKGRRVTSVSVDGEELPLLASDDLTILCRKGEELEKEIELLGGVELVPPIAAGDVVGRLILTAVDGKQYSVALTAEHDCRKESYTDALRQVVRRWLGLS